MRQTHIVLLPALLVLGAVSCGGGGQGGSGPPGGYTHENSGRPVVNGWDPFAPAQDPSPSATDFTACTGEGTITPSQVIDAVLLPICNMAATCGAGSTSTPATPQPATPGAGGTTSASSGLSTRDLVIGTPPSYCEQIYSSIDLNLQSDGFAGVCELFEKVSAALKQYPECNPPLVIPGGLCVDQLSACINDVVAMGCHGSLSTAPPSCAGVSFGSSSNSGGSGGSGGGNGNGGSGGSLDACQQCIVDCNNDNTCITNCFQTGPCAQN